MPRWCRGIAAVALLLCATGASWAAPDFPVRIDGRIFRKAAGKLVLSLSAFELQESQGVTLTNLRTGETREVALSSVYWDISYSVPLPPEVLDAVDPGEWVPSVTWRIPGTMEALRERLSQVYAHQNLLRKELGRATVEEAAEDVRVTSRLTLNKLEKFHRIAATLAGEYMRLVRESDKSSTRLHPVAIQIGYNLFGSQSPASRMSIPEQVRDAIYWEVHRILTQHFGLDESMVDFVFESPPNVRQFLPVGETGFRADPDFTATVTLAGETIDCAAYMQRQRFFEKVLHLVRLNWFRDPFITDRPLVDWLVNRGSVVGVRGNRVAVTFLPPFLKRGETVYVSLDEEGSEEVPVVLSSPVPDAGYTFTDELPAEVVSRIRSGMTVRRK